MRASVRYVGRAHPKLGIRTSLKFRSAWCVIRSTLMQSSPAFATGASINLAATSITATQSAKPHFPGNAYARNTDWRDRGPSLGLLETHRCLLRGPGGASSERAAHRWSPRYAASPRQIRRSARSWRSPNIHPVVRSTPHTCRDGRFRAKRYAAAILLRVGAPPRPPLPALGLLLPLKCIAP